MKIDNSTVRRQDRLMSQADAELLLARGEYGVLSLIDQSEGEAAPYALPINYVWDGRDTIYMHCATEGRKLRAIDANPRACLTIVGATEVNSRQFSTAYSSLILRGTVERGLDDEAKREAIGLFLGKYCPDNVSAGLNAAERSLYRTEILRFRIASASAKQKTATQKSPTRTADGA